MDGHRRHYGRYRRRMGSQWISQGPFWRDGKHRLRKRDHQSRRFQRLDQYRSSSGDRYQRASTANRILPRLAGPGDSLRLHPHRTGRGRQSRVLPESRFAGGWDARYVPRQWTLVRVVGSRIRKSFPIPISEGARLQLRFDFFNSLNRTNFNVSSQPPSGGLDDLGVFNRQNPNSAQFGLISSAFASRQIQVGAKITF